MFFVAILLYIHLLYFLLKKHNTHKKICLKIGIFLSFFIF
nr:MAG TPA: hypothetical protein [Caudoviricetes sp.]